jgi:hypothetical protein
LVIEVSPVSGCALTFNVHVNNDNSGNRDCVITSADTYNDNWENLSSFGDVTLDSDTTV